MALVSVVLPTFNAERFLGEAIDSVLSQTLRDLELVIVDDGSTDSTADIVARYRDDRIKLITFPSNRGLVEALNTGIGESRSELVARLDADDAAVHDRLRQQVALFESNRRLGLLGSGWWWDKDDGAPGRVARAPESLQHAAIRLGLHFENQFNHSSTMFRRECWKRAGGYQSGFAEDYSLWLRISAIAEVANIPQPLVLARSLDSSRSRMNSEANAMAKQRISAEALSTLLGRCIAPEVPTQFLASDCPSCDAFAEAEQLLLDSMHAIAQECDKRGVSRKGLTPFAAELLQNSRFRVRNGKRCIRALATLPAREPKVAAHLVTARARWWYRRFAHPSLVDSWGGRQLE